MNQNPNHPNQPHPHIAGTGNVQQQEMLQSHSTSVPARHHHTTFIPPHSGAAQQQQAPPIGTSYLTHQQPMPRAIQPPLHYQQQVEQVTNMSTLSQQQQQSKTRKLQVDDALSYLEKVRQQFANNPQVYNDFLEVMKEFKSHTIDTNGVIRRVSTLFRANPELIDGFNTFLPAGYEVRVQGSTVRIVEPNGAVLVIDNAAPIAPALGAKERPTSMFPAAGQPQQHISAPHQPGGGPSIKSPTTIGQTLPNTVTSRPLEPIGTVVSPLHSPELVHPVKAGHQHQDVVHESISHEPVKQIGHAPHPAVAESHAPPMRQSTIQQLAVAKSTAEQQSQSQQQPIHFDEALGYLNRIKERFANRPDVYREFLNILGNYQRGATNEGQKLTESDVFKSVARLFHNELDLMRDFKSFLPDVGLEFPERLERQQQQIAIESGEKREESNQQSSGSKVNSASRKHSNKNEQMAPLAKKAKSHINKVNYDLSIQDVLEEIPIRDFAIFEKIHNSVQNETVFRNFCRTLTLYNKSLVSKGELIGLVAPFLAGTPELFKEFKDMLGGSIAIGLQPKKQTRIEDRLPIEQAIQIDFETCKQLGVSYRALPEDFKLPNCSGRTALCNEVLNDKWVCIPQWSSEDTSAVSSKKSQFEELMYRTEDDRFEVDILIEVNCAAITALGVTLRKIESLTPAEAKTFVAEKGIGCSNTILSRSVKKLYGEHTGKVLGALRDNPHLAVPQVLKRMQEKDEEWRAARKEFNAIWRDQVEKNYVKSLDHQALAFKASDVKTIRNKCNIIQTLETIAAERQQKIDEGATDEWGPHLVVEYPEDSQVFLDANELLIHYVKRQANISRKEKKEIQDLLSSVIPRLFMLRVGASNDEDDKKGANERNGREKEATKERETSESAKSSQILRPKRGEPGSVSETATERRGDAADSSLDAEEIARELASNCAAAQKLQYILFFGSKSWLLFIRLHAMLCERLEQVKRRNEELVEEYQAELLVRERQKEIYEKHGSSVESRPMNAIDVHFGLRNLKKPLQNPENFYQIMLQETKNLLDGQVDATNFEDTLRSMFDTKAYVLFTIDKLVNALVRQLQHFVGDEVSMDSIRLFKAYYEQRINGHETGDLAKEVDQDYTETALKALSNQHCFKMYFFHHDHPILTVELIDTNESDADSSEEEEEEQESDNVVALHNWEDFLAKKGVVDMDFDPGLQNERKNFAQRNRRYRMSTFLYMNAISARESPNKNASSGKEEKDPKRFYVSNDFCTLIGEECPIKKLKDSDFEPITDVLVRKGAPPIDRKAHKKVAMSRRKKWYNWLDKFHQYDNELSARWLTTGCTSRLCQHPEFKYLRFSTYFSNKATTDGLN